MHGMLFQKVWIGEVKAESIGLSNPQCSARVPLLVISPWSFMILSINVNLLHKLKEKFDLIPT